MIISSSIEMVNDIVRDCEMSENLFQFLSI